MKENNDAAKVLRPASSEVPEQFVTPAIIRIALSSIDSPEYSDLERADFPSDTIQERLANATVDALPYEQVALLSFHQRRPMELDTVQERAKLETYMKAVGTKLDDQGKQERDTLEALGIQTKRTGKIPQQVTTFYSKYVGGKEHGLSQRRLRTFANDVIATCRKPLRKEIDLGLLQKRLASAHFIDITFGNEDTALLVKDLIMTQGLLMTQEGRKALISASHLATASFTEQEQTAFGELRVYLRAEATRREFFNFSSEKSAKEALVQIRHTRAVIEEQMAEGIDANQEPLMGKTVEETLAGANGEKKTIRFGNNIHIKPGGAMLIYTDPHGSEITLEYMLRVYGAFEAWERGERFVVLDLGDGVDGGVNQGQLLHTQLQLIEKDSDSYIKLLGDHEMRDQVSHDLGKYIWRMYSRQSNLAPWLVNLFNENNPAVSGVNDFVERTLGIDDQISDQVGLSNQQIITEVKARLSNFLQRESTDTSQGLSLLQQEQLDSYVAIMEEELGRWVGGTWDQEQGKYTNGIYDKYFALYQQLPSVATFNSGIAVHAGPPFTIGNLHETANDTNLPLEVTWGDPMHGSYLMPVDKQAMQAAITTVLEGSHEDEVDFVYEGIASKETRERLEQSLHTLEESGDIEFNQGRAKAAPLEAVAERAMLFPEAHVKQYLDATMGSGLREDGIGVLFTGHRESSNPDLKTRYIFADDARVIQLHSAGNGAPDNYRSQRNVATVAFIPDTSKPIKASDLTNVVQKIPWPVTR